MRTAHISFFITSAVLLSYAIEFSFFVYYSYVKDVLVDASNFRLMYSAVELIDNEYHTNSNDGALMNSANTGGLTYKSSVHESIDGIIDTIVFPDVYARATLSSIFGLASVILGLTQADLDRPPLWAWYICLQDNRFDLASKSKVMDAETGLPLQLEPNTRIITTVEIKYPDSPYTVINEDYVITASLQPASITFLVYEVLWKGNDPSIRSSVCTQMEITISLMRLQTLIVKRTPGALFQSFTAEIIDLPNDRDCSLPNRYRKLVLVLQFADAIRVESLGPFCYLPRGNKMTINDESFTILTRYDGDSIKSFKSWPETNSLSCMQGNSFDLSLLGSDLVTWLITSARLQSNNDLMKLVRSMFAHNGQGPVLLHSDDTFQKCSTSKNRDDVPITSLPLDVVCIIHKLFWNFVMADTTVRDSIDIQLVRDHSALLATSMNYKSLECITNTSPENGLRVRLLCLGILHTVDGAVSSLTKSYLVWQDGDLLVEGFAVLDTYKRIPIQTEGGSGVISLLFPDKLVIYDSSDLFSATCGNSNLFVHEFGRTLPSDVLIRDHMHLRSCLPSRGYARNIISCVNLRYNSIIMISSQSSPRPWESSTIRVANQDSCQRGLESDELVAKCSGNSRDLLSLHTASALDPQRDDMTNEDILHQGKRKKGRDTRYVSMVGQYYPAVELVSRPLLLKSDPLRIGFIYYCFSRRAFCIPNVNHNNIVNLETLHETEGAPAAFDSYDSNLVYHTLFRLETILYDADKKGTIELTALRGWSIDAIVFFPGTDMILFISDFSIWGYKMNSDTIFLIVSNATINEAAIGNGILKSDSDSKFSPEKIFVTKLHGRLCWTLYNNLRSICCTPISDTPRFTRPSEITCSIGKTSALYDIVKTGNILTVYDIQDISESKKVTYTTVDDFFLGKCRLENWDTCASRATMTDASNMVEVQIFEVLSVDDDFDHRRVLPGLFVAALVALLMVLIITVVFSKLYAMLDQQYR